MKWKKEKGRCWGKIKQKINKKTKNCKGKTKRYKARPKC